MSDRKLVTIQQIESLTPIEGADKIEKATMVGLGWECVVEKNKFKIDDFVKYFEIDTICPDGLSEADVFLLNNIDDEIANAKDKEIDDEIANAKNKEIINETLINSLYEKRKEILDRNTRPEFEFLRDRKFRIKTLKLRKQVSQGLIMPFGEKEFTHTHKEIGVDLTELLGVTKYLSPSEQEEFNQLSSKKHWTKNYKVTNYFWKYKWFRNLIIKKKINLQWPDNVTHTDEERIQNIPKVLEQFKDKLVYISEKVDYQSVTFTSKLVPRFNNRFGKLMIKLINKL